MERINQNLIKEKHRALVFNLLGALKNHSEETYAHSVDVAEKAIAIAESLGVGQENYEKLYTASLLHDIGKLYIDEELLHKQNATESELEIIRFGHIVGTKAILCDYFDADFVRLAAHHHERLDSSGYPEHLNASKLDILDRILQVADVTSALAMSRSYKDAYDVDHIVNILNDLVKNGELDEMCVREMEKIYLTPLKEQQQSGLRK